MSFLLIAAVGGSTELASPYVWGSYQVLRNKTHTVASDHAAGVSTIAHTLNAQVFAKRHQHSLVVQQMNTGSAAIPTAPQTAAGPI